MPRLTRKLFIDLAIWMLSIGLLVGFAFPFVLVLYGFPKADVLSLNLFMATMAAGAALATTAFAMIYGLLQPRLHMLVEHIHTTEGLIRNATESTNWKYCTPESCVIPVDSDDELGATAEAFNQLVTELVRSRQLDHAAAEFSTSLSSLLDLEKLNRRALELFLEHTKAAAGAVFLETRGELQVAASHGLAELETVSRSPHLLRAMQTNQVQSISLPQDIQVESVLTKFRPAEVLVIPISFKDNALACVVLATAHQFKLDTPWLIELVRHGFGLALNNALTHARLQHTAMVDPLTEVYNRGFGMTRLREEFSRSKRSGAGLGVLLFDIDHFKKINDTHGHLVGDRVLVKIASIAKSSLREGDVLVRYGGEEFLVILPGVDLVGAHEVAERLRKLIANCRMTIGGDGLTVTVSVGFAATPDNKADGEQKLLLFADTALYQAKRNGRNQVAHYSEKMGK